MGGNKKKTLASIEKEQAREEIKKISASEKKKEKPEDKNKSKSEFMMTLSDSEVMRVIKGMQFVTPYQLSNATGVKMSVARVILQQLSKKNLLEVVGGYSGRYIYTQKAASQ